MQELEHTAATLAAMDVSDETLTDARNEFQSQKASHKRYELSVFERPEIQNLLNDSNDDIGYQHCAISKP